MSSIATRTKYIVCKWDAKYPKLPVTRDLAPLARRGVSRPLRRGGLRTDVREMARLAHHFELRFVVVPLVMVGPRCGTAGDTERVALRRVGKREGEGAVKGAEPRRDEREWVQGLREQTEGGPVG